MRPINFKISIYILILFSFSCSTKIELDIPASPPQIVVNSLITKDSLVSVSVFKTAPMLSNDIDFVNNAGVELFGQGNFIEKLQLKEAGIYQSTIRAEAGIDYQIYIEVPEFPEISSSAKIPPPVAITGGTIKLDSYYDQQQLSYESEIEISFYDPPEIENYYQVTFYSYSFGASEWDTIINDFIVTDSTRYYSDISFLNSNDPVITNEGDLQYYHEGSEIRSLVFSDKLLNKNRSISFLVGGLGKNSVVVLRNISFDYYKFHKSKVRQAFNQGLGSFDATNAFLVVNPNDLYSNIENGLGIFAGYSETHFDLDVIE